MNDLVASVESSTSWHSGTGFIDTIATTGEAAGRGDWAESMLNGAVGGLETLGVIADPLGPLISAGIGFVIEHFGPLKQMLDDLAGDPDRISSFAGTWVNVAERIDSTADDLRSAVRGLGADWDGPAMVAYQAFAEMQADLLHAFSVMVRGVAGAVETGGVIVGAVRNIVRDLISDVVGYALSKAVQILTIALAPKAIAELVAKIGEWVGKARTFISNLIDAMGRLGDLLKKLGSAASDGHVKIQEIASRVAYLEDSFKPLPDGTLQLSTTWLKTHSIAELAKSATAADD